MGKRLPFPTSSSTLPRGTGLTLAEKTKRSYNHKFSLPAEVVQPPFGRPHPLLGGRKDLRPIASPIRSCLHDLRPTPRQQTGRTTTIMPFFYQASIGRYFHLGHLRCPGGKTPFGERCSGPRAPSVPARARCGLARGNPIAERPVGDGPERASATVLTSTGGKQ